MQNDVLQKAREIITGYEGKELRIMEVCGTHTHEIFRLGIRSLLPPAIRLISGPGCPVCVTPVRYIDEAIWLALEKGATIATFGDLLRVPGSSMSLARARQNGAKISIVYSPLDAVALAAKKPEENIVFLSVGFETTVPAECLAVRKAKEENLRNFFLLCANKTMPEAYRALEGSADVFLYPGHVSAITGTEICKTLRDRGVSGVIAGFTASELLTALSVIILESKKGRPFFANCYPRVVKDEGNPEALRIIRETMDPCDSEWRGLSVIPGSGLTLKTEYRDFDAKEHFAIPALPGKQNPRCRCGDILRGVATPKDCPLFGGACTPDHPIGACMVSSEGTCSAYYQYGSEEILP
ncbi:MAG: hydrogenase formation protein HypD [Desulfovibrio sp.]|nr:hydrogenase formation protein HypD [Desulfovibrio sp.]